MMMRVDQGLGALRAHGGSRQRGGETGGADARQEAPA